MSTVYTVVVFAGAADSTHLTEVYRKHFSSVRAARQYARARVVKRPNGHHVATVWLGRPSAPLAEHVAEYTSAARTGKVRTLARPRCDHAGCGAPAVLRVDSFMSGKLIESRPACEVHAPMVRMANGPISYVERPL